MRGAVEDGLRAGGAAEVWLGQGPPVWLWPGVDPRYTAMVCLAERTGYQRRGEEVNMAVDLRTASTGTGGDERRLAAAGISVRRAGPGEAGPIAACLRRAPWCPPSWPAEVELALALDPPRCHVAARGDTYPGFACHGFSRSTRFGPMGTRESERQHGIGTVLLRRCLADMKAAGHVSAQIGWTGPIRFYARAVGARIDRAFWPYRKVL